VAAKLRSAGVIVCVAGLCALGAAPASATASQVSRSSAPSASAASASAVSASAAPAARSGVGLVTLGRAGWEVQSTAANTDWTTGTGATQAGSQISAPGFSTAGWLPVASDDGGAAGTEVEALLQSGICPDDTALEPVNQSADGPGSVFYSDNLTKCFGAPMTNPGVDTNPLFNMPWWFRTSFSPDVKPGQDAKLVVNGVVGQADVWVNGTEVATEATVEGDYASYTFDVTSLLRPGPNVLALELYPNNPATMLTLDNVDWTQIPPDNNTGIQFPVQLHIADALDISNAFVTQDDAPDMSRAGLTVHADVTNDSDAPQAGVVTATITAPGGGGHIQVAQPVTLAPGASTTVTFTPAAYGQLVIRNPKLWWPYQMGGQPLYRLQAAVSGSAVSGGAVSGSAVSGSAGRSDAAPPVDFGIRQVTTYLTRPSAQTPEGVRVFEINGVPFSYRAGGWSENLFLHYSASDLANQISIIKSMGLNGIRTEGKEMPQDFYNQMDRAGILIDAGFQCCDSWQPSSSGRGVTSQSYHVMYESSLAIGQRLRDHPSILDYSWSDNQPINEQEAASLAGFSQSGFQEPIISSAEYNTSAILGPSGEKEGPYDWVPPDYWYDTTHSSNNANDNDSTLTNVGASWGFDSEEGSGDTVPTIDSIERFLSPSDQATLWQQPDAHQFHTNYESTDGSHSGYSFGTLDNLDTAVQSRYGSWTSLAQYDLEAQAQNYEDTRAQFESFIDHWNNGPTPATGTVYWQLNKGWPTLLWDLYNYDYDEAGAYFGAKKANEDLHVLYAYDTGGVTVDNLTGASQGGLSVESRVYGTDGSVLADQTTSHPLALKSQQVARNVLDPRVPAATTPPTPAKTYFVEVILRQHGKVVDRNVYWLSTQQDVIDWNSTEGNPQADNGAPLSQYTDMSALQGLPSEPVRVAASTAAGKGGSDVTSVTITNPSSNPAVAFFVRADVRRGTADAAALPGDNEVLPITWSDNDITLWPGESETLTGTYKSSLLRGASPVVSIGGWNVPSGTHPAPPTAAAVSAERAAQGAPRLQHFGVADGTPRASAAATGATVSARSTVSAAPGGAAVTGKAGTRDGRWTITSVANSPDATPTTSFKQGDSADTYTLTVTNSGKSPTDGTTPVTLTDIVDPNISMTSIGGSGWTCDTSNDPTEACTETGGPGGTSAVLKPGQSYPPITLTVQVPLGTGFGTQDSTDGLHVTNGVFVTGGSVSAPGWAQPSASIATRTPIVGVPGLTADNAVDGAFQQGGTGRYEITVINEGAAPTQGAGASPVTATITALPVGVSVQGLYGSGWTCNLGAITSPRAEPADTCYRDDVLAGENGEEPPITVVASVAPNAAASGNETVKVSGGGDASAPASVSAATTIRPAPIPATGTPAANPPVLTVAGTQAGSFSQGDARDAYTLTVSDAATAGPTTGEVTVADTMPPGLTPVEMTGNGWTCSLAPATLPPTTSGRNAPPNTYEPQPTCVRSDSLAPGSAYPPITLRVAVADNTQPSVTNVVTATGGGAAQADTGTDPTIIGQLPLLDVTGYPSAGGILYAPFARGHAGADTYTVTVANDGYAATSAPVTVQAGLPAGLTAESVTADSGWTCTLASVTCTTKAGVHLAAGERDQITVTVAVSGDAPPSADTLLLAAGGGAVPAAAIDENNDYSVVSNGGEYVVPTYIAPDRAHP
jgi:exo-1,4-beta-D-glucosaminidase